MGKKSGPSPDPRIGEAALKSAELGEDYLKFMKGQAKISTRWAREDRRRWTRKFVPLQDQFINEAQNFDSPQATARARTEAVADVRLQTAQADAARSRQMARMGVDPRSGAWNASSARAGTQASLAAAGAGNIARERVRATGRSLRASAVNLGSGLAINPATSLGMSNSATGSGFQGAMRGQQQAGNLLQTQHQNAVNAHQAKLGGWGQLAGAMGSVIGLTSDEDKKTDKAPVNRSLLKAVRRMRVEQWRYKDGVEDGGTHIGTYAQDFQRETGRGDGRTIPIVDAIGVTMGGLKELDAKVEKLVATLTRAQGPAR